MTNSSLTNSNLTNLTNSSLTNSSLTNSSLTNSSLTNRCLTNSSLTNSSLTNSLQGLLNCGIGGLDCRVITTEYRTHVYCIHMNHLFRNVFVHVIYIRVSGQCSYTIEVLLQFNVILHLHSLVLL